ncbi:recombination protein [Vibrio phage 1.081.O._10N.286.52.C2]|nr:recombination protein [Vibrio phage 1.081.O._10N.286.52.C2]
MNLEDLKREYKEDVKIDTTKIELAAINIPVLHGKWLCYRADARKLLLKAELKMERTRTDRWMYYSGKHDDEVCDYIVEKSEMKFALAGDPTLQTQIALYTHVKDVLSFTEEALKGISQMGFTIKHIIDNRKIESGIV